MMANDSPSFLWNNIESGVWYRDDPSGSVRVLPARRFPTSRLPRDAERFRGVRFWWRIDGAERWRPAGGSARLSAEHAGGHIVAMDFARVGRDAAPCPICERNGWRAFEVARTVIAEHHHERRPGRGRLSRRPRHECAHVGLPSPELRCVDTSAERAVVRLFACSRDHGVRCVIVSGEDACRRRPCARRSRVARQVRGQRRSTRSTARTRRRQRLWRGFTRSGSRTQNT